MTVTSLGFFRELPHGDPDGPSIQDFLSKGDPVVKDRLAEYLASGSTLAAATSFAYDVLSDERIKTGRVASLTDGVWMWPADLAYYVRTYNVALPDEFVARAASLEWIAPSLSRDDLLAIEDELFPE